MNGFLVFAIIFTHVTLLLAAYPLAVFIKKKLNIQSNSSVLFSIGLFIWILNSLIFHLIFKDSYLFFEFKAVAFIVLQIVNLSISLFAWTLFVLAFLNRDKTQRMCESLCNISFSVICFLMPFCYFVLGVFQFWAIYDGFSDWLGLHWILTFPLAVVIGYIPIIGTVFGVFGAVNG